MAATSIALGWFGLDAATADDPAFVDSTALDISYFTAQLFVLSSEPVSGPGPFPFALEVARFLAPLTTALAVLEAVYALARDRIQSWRIARSRDHAIVTGDNEVAWALAERLAEDGPVVAIAADPSRHPAPSPQLRIVVGDVEDEATLRAAGVGRASALYACSERGALNVGVGLLARGLTRSPLTVRARSADAELVAALRARRVSNARRRQGFRLDFFAVEGLAARALVDDHGPFETDPHAVVTVIGSGPFARAVVVELADRWPEGRSRPLRWVDHDPDADGFLARFGHSNRVDTSAEAEPDEDGLIVVCPETSDEALRVGLLQARRSVTTTVLICLPARSAIADALESEAVFDDMGGRLRVFGILDAACEPQRIDCDLIDQLARGLHDHYLETCRANGDTAETNASMIPWEDLPPELVESNYAQADHIGVKLDAIGAVIIPALDGLSPFELSDAEIERLAELEHERWMRSQTGQGVVFGPDRIPGITHPDLRPWSELDEPARDKDRAFVEALPALLASRRLAILRLPAEAGPG